jgi:hypothetical protein
MESMGSSPIRKKTMRKGNFSNKLLRIIDKLKIQAGKAYKINVETLDFPCSNCDSITKTVKEKVPNADTKKEKYRMLTCLPQTFSCRNIERDFGVSKWVAEKVSKLRKEKGPFSFPEFRTTGHPLSEETKQLVIDYYLDDSNSRISPRADDTIWVRTPEGKISVTKQFMLFTLNEMYSEFKKQNEDIKIGMTRFAELKPQQCKWMGSAGVHRSCTCEQHENMKFLLEGIYNASEIASNQGNTIDEEVQDDQEDEDDNPDQLDDTEWNYVRTFLTDMNTFYHFMTCESKDEDTEEECYMGYCNNCPSPEKFDLLTALIPDVSITFRQWTKTDGTTLEIITESVDDFAFRLERVVRKFITHHYIYMKQSNYIKLLKGETIRDTSIGVVFMDFAQNYTFLIQDAIMGEYI